MQKYRTKNEAKMKTEVLKN